MRFVRATLFCTAALLAGAVTITTQAQTQKTWTDEDLDKMMKEVGGTVGALRKAIDGQNAELAKSNAEKMAKLFGEVNAFWQSRNVTDASETATTAMKHAKTLEEDIDAKNFGKAAEDMKALQSACATCHGKYRDKGPDGQYRIKP